MQYALNPLFPNELKLGGVAYGDSATILYNPNGYVPYTVRSEPEGELFATYSAYVRPGTTITTRESFVPDSSLFAYWTVNGVRQADAWGVALNAATFTVGDDPIEAVAHCVDDAQTRQAYYWYGKAADPESDLDGDGYTFAEELQAGLNPVFPNVLQLGGVAHGDSNVVLYNPNEYPEVTIRSEPAGIFATESVVLRPGQEHTTATYTPNDNFAQWTRNGAREADAWGRALDAVTIVGNPGVGKVDLVAHFVDDAHTRLSRYWYGVDDQDEASDTDGDGYTFAEELQAGMNPLFPNRLVLGGVATGDGPTLESNLQPFDMGGLALVEGALEELFATLDGKTGELTGGRDFGGPAAVAVVDFDQNEAFDVLVFAQGDLWTLRNVGVAGSPEWAIAPAAEVVEQPGLAALEGALAALARPVMAGGTAEAGPAVWFCDDGGAVSRYDLATGEIVDTGLTGFPVWDETDGLGVFANNTLTLGDQTLTLDAAVEAPCAAALADATGDGTADLLVADTSGRVALYARTADGFALEHRVWGGSFAGFAEGLTLAPVDWEPDGDLDMLCGTAGGKLLLLSDPNVGKPSNLRATAGYDNVLLEWDPNGQSRVYGYGVYRAQGGDFSRIAEASLPTHRDTPPSLATWSYRVTALSRLWTAGNSEPETFESLPSEVVSVDLGGVTLSMPEVLTSYDDAEIALPIAVDNTKGLGAFTLTVTYDSAIVEPLGYEPTALTEGLVVTSTPVDGTWTLSATGALTAGSGPLFRLRFHVKAGAFGETAFRLNEADFTATDGKPVATNALPIETTLTVQARPLPATVTLRMEDAQAKTGETIRVPVTVEAADPIDWATLTLIPAFDASKLRLVSRTEATEGEPTLTLTFEVLEQHGDNLFATVTVAGTATGANGLPATVLPATATIAITDSNPPVPAVVTLTMEDTEAATLSEVTLEVRTQMVGEPDWATLTLTPTYDTAKLRLIKQTPATAETPATLTFEVLEQHGDNLFATVTVSGTATSANGLPATVLSATATIRITDSNPPKPAIVTLSATDVFAEVGATVTLTVSATNEGDLLWETLTLTPEFDGAWLELVEQPPATAATPATFTFRVRERYGENLATDVTFRGTATSANGLPATIVAATCRVLIADNPLEPAVVSLRLPNRTVETLSRVSLTVDANAVGEVDWATLALRAQWDSAKLDLVSQEERTFVFTVKDVHEDLSTTVTITGTATSANGLPAVVQSAICTLTLIDANPPVPAKVALRTEKTVAAMTEAELAVEVEVAVTEGELDWESLALSAAVGGSGTLTLRNQTKPTVKNPVATFTFDVPEQHGDNLIATLTFSGTAMSANGFLPANIAPTTSVVTLTDSNPPVPVVVTLAAEGGSAVTESEVTLAVRVGTVGELDWGSLALTATVEAGGLELRSQTAATVENPTATFTFWVPEQHGDDLFARVTFTGSATSANGLPAQVAPTTVTLALTDSNPPKDPTEVPPWSSGDVDGDGKLTRADYETAREAILHYHRSTIRPPRHSSDPNAIDNKIHRSICQALGRGENGTLAVADITAFQRYLEGILGEMPKEAAQ